MVVYEIYQNAEETKFIPLVFEYLEDGKPAVPVFVKSRIFIDLSCDDKYEEGYDQLLRDIYGKPRFQRPPIGQMPSYLASEEPILLPTSNKVKAIKSAILAANPNTHLLIKDYLDLFLHSLMDYKIDYRTLNDRNFINVIETSIDSMMPLKDDFLDFISIVAGTQYFTGEQLSDFFEHLLQVYADNGINLYEGNTLDCVCFDNFRYFNQDLFLSVVTLLLSKEQFEIIHELVSHHYCIIEENYISSSSKELSFMRFRAYNYTLNRFKNEANQLRCASVVANLVKKNAIKVRFEDMVRADLLLYYLSLIYPSKDTVFERCWYPELSVYNRRFAVLPKLASARFFNKAKVMFGVSDAESFKSLISSIKEPDVRDGIHQIPSLLKGLSLEEVATIL